MSRGKVKFYNSEKRFGFIVPDDGSKDVFFHSSGLTSPDVQPQEEDVFEYDLEDGERGPKAVNLRLEN